MTEAGCADRVTVRRLAIENLASLLPEQAHSFDLVLANFGALNLASESGSWGPAVSRLLKHDGRLIANVVNRWCLPELVAGLVRLRPSFALRRPRGLPITVGGIQLSPSLYSPREFNLRLRPWLQPIGVRGLGVTFPPPALEHSLPGLATGRLSRLADRLLGRLPGLRNLGDHFLITMRPRLEVYTLFKADAPITASPVVEDVNGDGAMEVVLASDRLSVLDGRGEPLQGWPRRTPKPIASTPLVVRDEDGTSIFVGSDDHRLHGFDIGGRRRPGFPYTTGGDVFSSPWGGDLSGDGRRELAFGSDDGRIYVIDLDGRPRPGWPVRTGGYVSASPAVAHTEEGDALFIGSWDGKLYGLASRGTPLPGWPRNLGFPIWSTAAVADLDGDGRAEVIVAAHHLFALRGDGEALPGFPQRLGGYAVGSPAVADIDDDGLPEVIVASDRVYAFRADGAALAGFPLDLGAYVWASPLLVDVDGDGRPEIVVADMAGGVWAIGHDGRVLAGWPRKAGRRIAATPTAADLDHDGYLELLVATWDGRTVVFRTEARADDHRASPWRSFPPARILPGHLSNQLSQLRLNAGPATHRTPAFPPPVATPCRVMPAHHGVRLHDRDVASPTRPHAGQR